MRNISFVLLLLILNRAILDAQPLDYSAGKELLQEQLVKFSLRHDSIFSIREYPVNGKLFYTRGNKYIHPFFIDNDWKSGMIWSSDNVYNINMVKYDISNDYLVILYYMDSFAYPVYLNKESVKEFMISGHHFRYMNDFGNSPGNELKPGYYELLYDGITKVCVRWEKLSNLNNAASDPVYSQKVNSFLKMKGKYVRIMGQKSFINALTDHEKEIKMYMKKNNLRFSGNNFEILGKVLEYYENL